MIEIRKMLPEDLGQVGALESEIFSTPWSEQGFLQSLLQHNTLYLVAVQNGVVVGYCGLLQVLDEADITNVAVSEKYRGQGIAGAMLRQLLKKGGNQGIRAFTLEVRKSNEAAIHLYETLGFSKEGIRPGFYEKPTEDAVIMWKR